MSPQQLRKFLHQHFNLSELRTLCFELDIPYEDLSGDNRQTKTISVVEYAQSRNLYGKLIEYVQKKRRTYFERLLLNRYVEQLRYKESKLTFPGIPSMPNRVQPVLEDIYIPQILYDSKTRFC